MLLFHPGQAVSDNDVGTTQPPTVRTDQDTPSLQVSSYGHKTVQNTVASEEPESSHQFLVIFDDTQDVSVEEDSEDPLVADLLPREEPHVLHAAVVGQADDGALGEFGGDVSHQGQVLHQAAALPLGCVTRNSLELVLVVITVTGIRGNNSDRTINDQAKFD